MKVITLSYIKILLFVYILSFPAQHSYSQDENFWSHVRFGGNIGIGFSNNSFSGMIAPSAIYHFNEQLGMGVSISFGYTDAKNYTATNYGASFITLYSPIKQLQLSAEFEEMGVHRNFEFIDGDITEDYWYPALFIGAGYNMGFMTAGLRYDVLYDIDKSIYGSAYAPFIRVYF